MVWQAELRYVVSGSCASSRVVPDYPQHIESTKTGGVANRTLWGPALTDALSGPIPVGGEDALAHYADQLRGHLGHAIYVGTPINTGPALLSVLRAERSALRTDDPTRLLRIEALRARVVRQNLAAYGRLLGSVVATFPDAATIDPTTLDSPQWDQRDYYRVCVELVRRHSTTAVFRDGWEFSIGCQIEMIAALARNVLVCDQHFDPITPALAVAAASESAAEYAAVGWRPPLAAECIHALTDLAGHGAD